MTVLFLTSRVPYPPYRGDKLKIFNLIRELSQRHVVHLISFYATPAEAKALSGLRGLCGIIRLVPLPAWRSFVNCIAAVPRGIPFQVAYYNSHGFHHVVEEVLREHKPDIIHTHLIRMAPYGLRVEGIPRVLDLTDAVSLYLKRFREATANPLLQVAAEMEMRRMIEYEKIIERYDRVLVCSEPDRQVLLHHAPHAAIELLPNGIDLKHFSTGAYTGGEEGRIIMTGNMSYLPNVDGVRWLADEVFPLVRRALPAATLYVVGQNPPRGVRKRSGGGIVVTGFVADIRAEYLKSAVAVSPIRFGAGTLNKVLEPMALGVPVVATSLGMDGLGLEEGKDYLRGDDARTFAEAIIKLLTDRNLRRALGSSAQEKVRKRFGWNTVAMKLEQVYRTTIRGG